MYGIQARPELLSVLKTKPRTHTDRRNAVNTVSFCCSQLETASAAKKNHPTALPPTTYLPPPRLTFGSRSEARRARAARRGGAEAGALHPARGRHRLAPQLTALRPLRRRTTGVAQKATPGVG